MHPEAPFFVHLYSIEQKSIGLSFTLLCQTDMTFQVIVTTMSLLKIKDIFNLDDKKP